MQNKSWIIKVFLLTFIICLLISGLSNVIANNANIIVLLIIIHIYGMILIIKSNFCMVYHIGRIVTVIIIFIGIIFDIIGTAVLTANEATFHAKASNKIRGSKESIKLIKNASNIANFCNDIIGDICGIVSGSMGAMIAFTLSTKLNINPTLMALIISSIISSIMVGGKAIGKNIAIKKSDKIIFAVGKILNKTKSD